MTGVDISDVVIDIAGEIAQQAGIRVTFVRADVYALPDVLQQADFDVVWSRAGIVYWLPDLDAWASVVARALRPGGRFVLSDIHPVRACLWYRDGGIEVCSDYFGRSAPEPSTDLGVIACGAASTETNYQFSWPLADVVTAVARSGMRIESLEEFPTQQVPYSARVRDDVVVPSLVLQLPGSYRLVAVREE